MLFLLTHEAELPTASKGTEVAEMASACLDVWADCTSLELGGSLFVTAIAVVWAMLSEHRLSAAVIINNHRRWYSMQSTHIRDGLMDRHHQGGGFAGRLIASQRMLLTRQAMWVTLRLWCAPKTAPATIKG